MQATVAGESFVLDAAQVVRALDGIDAEPIQDHLVVVGTHRYPPKQVLAAVTGLDRADFTTHQARSILRRLGFGVYRRRVAPPGALTRDQPGGASQSLVLEPYAGRWVAQDGNTVLFHADTWRAVLTWLRTNRLRARVWKVPSTPGEAGSMQSSA